jgi:uncharacterized protein (DUF1015 family)
MRIISCWVNNISQYNFFLGVFTMANIVPFPGVRPNAELASRIAAVPYDVIEREEATEIAKQNPYTFIHIEKSEVDIDPKVSGYDPSVYQQGANNLREFVEKGWLIHDEEPCFYVYAQTMGKHHQIGLVAGASVEEYEKNIIKKHELTRQDKEDDRTNHVSKLNANTGPVFLTYKHSDSINAIIDEICKGKPCYDFDSEDHVHHTFWVVNDPETIKNLRNEFSKIDYLYVADGHHRSAAAMRVREMRKAENPLHTGKEPYNFFLTVIFPDNQMQIMAYNRFVHDLNGMTPEEFMNKIKTIFNVTPTDNPNPRCLHELTMFLEKQWYCLTVKDEYANDPDVVNRLDVAILQNHVLDPMLGIKNPRTDKRITFVGGIHGTDALSKAVLDNGQGVSFALYPVSIAELMAIADAGKIMPPKSTWFEPKLKSGLIVKPLS